jgi:poly-gamma-glutamate capsule biosynthesis protein CapA/YwtB (metallophosphatase superfamily)
MDTPMTSNTNNAIVTVFMCGDVMTGRGIDQILPHPVDPCLHEPFMTSACGYVEIAEKASGPIPRPVDFGYIWGDALAIFEQLRPDVKLINLETSVTRQDTYWPGKGINYRMSPANFPAITAAGIDVCALANNHVLDWGYPGLDETLLTLEEAGVRGAGAGRDLATAAAPATVAVPGRGRVVVFSFGDASSGIPTSWGAAPGRPGVNLLPDLSERTVHLIGERVREVKRRGDLVIASIHWGDNWGFKIPKAHVAFAHRLIDEAAADIIHGHSSHHVKGIEVYRGKPIIYGCGDFIDDYEGIGGYELYRGDLGLMYFVSMDVVNGRLTSLRLVPTQIGRFRVSRATVPGTRWLRETLNREGEEFGTHVADGEDQSMVLRWEWVAEPSRSQE